MLRCANHGWCFDAVRALHRHPFPCPHGPIPERARVTPFAVEIAHGLVWVRLESGAPTTVPAHPSWDAPGCKVLTGEPYTWPTSAARRVENFVDIAHFPWVHDGSLGRRDEPVPPLPEVPTRSRRAPVRIRPAVDRRRRRGAVRLVGVPHAHPADRRHRVPARERRDAVALDDRVAGGRADVPARSGPSRATTISTATTTRTWRSRS